MTESTSNFDVGIYVRISQDAEDDGLGVARQKQDCETLALSLGWHVVAIYEDNDISATSGKRRPAYERMAKDVDQGKLRGIVVWDVDRLTRTPRELEDVIDWAGRHGLHLASVGGDIDLRNPQGRMMARIKGTVARHEVEQSSRRIKRKRQELAERGRYVGPRPYGWDWTSDQRLQINESEAAVVRESAQRVISGESIRSIVYDLNNRGIATNRGNKWQASNFRAMVLRWTNCGVLIHRGQEIGPGNWSPIVSREDHERVVAILTDPMRRTNNRGTAEKYLLSGLIQCAECDGKMLGAAENTYKIRYPLANGEMKEGSRTQPYRYRCQTHGCRKVSREMGTLDVLVTEYIVGLLERDGVRILSGDSVAAQTARTRCDEIGAKLNLAADQWASDLITGDQLQRITARLRPELEAARAELSFAMPADGLADFTGPPARQTWENSTLEQQRNVIRALRSTGLRIIVCRSGRGRGGQSGPAAFDPDTVRINWVDQGVGA